MTRLLGVVSGSVTAIHDTCAGYSAAETGFTVRPVDNFRAPHFGFLRYSSQRKSLMATRFYHCFGEAKKAGDIRGLDKNARLGSFFVPDPCSSIQILQ